MTRTIEIQSYMTASTHEASFEPVRSAENMTLGWATVEDLRFPAIVVTNQTKRGYTVYTVSDWQAPASSFGDLSDPLDWAMLCKTGTGKFINPRLEAAQPLSTRPLDLPLSDKQANELVAWTTRNRSWSMSSEGPRGATCWRSQS